RREPHGHDVHPANRTHGRPATGDVDVPGRRDRPRRGRPVTGAQPARAAEHRRDLARGVPRPAPAGALVPVAARASRSRDRPRPLERPPRPHGRRDRRPGGPSTRPGAGRGRAHPAPRPRCLSRPSRQPRKAVIPVRVGTNTNPPSTTWDGKWVRLPAWMRWMRVPLLRRSTNRSPEPRSATYTLAPAMTGDP